MAAPHPADAPIRLTVARGRGWAATDFGTDRLARLIAADDCPDPAAVLKKAGNTAAVLRGELALAGGPAAVCWKRIRRKTTLKRLATAVRTRRTVLTYAHAGRLRRAGVDTPRPLACTAPPRLSVDRPAWLLTEWVDGTEDLAVARGRLAGLPAGERLRVAGRYAAAAGATLGRLHAAGASHRDLKPNNLLAALAPAAPRAWVIDLDAVRFPLALTDRRRRRDLARLLRGLPDVPLTARVRFLKSYAEGRGRHDRGAWRAEWRALAG